MSILNYQYDLFLCTLNKEELTQLDSYNVQVTKNFNSFNELDFNISYYLNNIDSVIHKSVDDRFDLVKTGRTIKLITKENDTVLNIEYFYIDSATSEENSNGTIYKNIHCYSLQYKLFNEGTRLRAYKNQVRTLYDPSNNYNPIDNTKGGIINYMLENGTYGTWTVSYISPTLLDIYHVFDISDATYTDVFKQLEKEYNCFIFFNNVDNTIQIYDKTEVGQNTGFVFSDQNYLKKITNESKTTGLITRVYVYGKNNTPITKYNPTGKEYIEDLSYYIDNGLTSPGFITAWNNYLALISSKEGDFTTYVNTLDNLQSQLLTKQNELEVLQSELDVIHTQMDALKISLRKNNSAYSSLVSNQNSKLNEISIKEGEISAIESSISSTISDIATLQDEISYENNFTTEQLEEMVNYIHINTVTLNNVSDDRQLYDYAVAYLELKSQFPLSIDLDSIDVFSCKEGELDRSKIILGDYVNLYAPEIGYDYYAIRIVNYTHNETGNSLNIKLSNTDDLNTKEFNLSKFFTVANQTANIMEVEKDTYAEYSINKDNIINIGDTIDAEETEISFGNNFINQRGFIGSNIGSNGALQLLNDKIIISKDNFNTFKTLLSGNGLYLESDDGTNRVVIEDSGFQLDIYNPDPSIQDFRNAIYCGLDNDDNPAFFIDNGYISLTHIESGTPKNNIYLNPADGIKIQKSNGLGGWTNTFYTDNNGNTQITDGYISLIKTELNEIKIDPNVGMTIGKYNPVAGNYNDLVFYLDTNGILCTNEIVANNATIQGTFKTGGSGDARIVINNNGLISYNSDNKKNGLYVSAGNFVDLLMYNENYVKFWLYDIASPGGIGFYAMAGEKTPGIDYPTEDKCIFTSIGSNTTPFNTWNCSKASFTNLSDGVSDYVTKEWVNSKGFLEENEISGSFTTVDGKTIMVQNGQIITMV